MTKNPNSQIVIRVYEIILPNYLGFGVNTNCKINYNGKFTDIK